MNDSTTEDKDTELYGWKAQAKFYRMIINIGVFTIVILSWYLIATMAESAALTYESGDLIYPFVKAAGVITLVYISLHFIDTIDFIYGNEIEEIIEHIKQKSLSLYSRLICKVKSPTKGKD